MRLKQIFGLPVVDSRVARQAGTIADVFVDPRDARVAALDVLHGDGWLLQRVPAAYVRRVTSQAVLVVDSVEMELDEIRIHDRAWLRGRTLLGLEVLTEGGDCLGHVADVQLDARTLDVLSYELNPPLQGRLLGAPARIAPGDLVRYSSELLLVRPRPPRGVVRAEEPRLLASPVEGWTS